MIFVFYCLYVPGVILLYKKNKGTQKTTSKPWKPRKSAFANGF